METMRKGLISTLAVLLLSNFVYSQFSLTLTTYSENFNTLANSGTSSSVPTGWAFNESGSGADATYAVSTGSSTGGNTYSFGAASNPERAFGGLQSNTVNPTIGFYFINNTGSPITSLVISYTGEQWRLGATSRTDRMDFQYSANATSLTTGIWIDQDNLDFTAPVTSGTVGPLDGNTAPNRTVINYTITGLNIANGSTFFFRWVDYNGTGSDDGLGVDDFSFTATLGTPTSITTGTITGSPFSLADCFDTKTGSVDFTSVGTFSSNTYSVQVSDAAGSFASAVIIGSLASDANSGTINFTIPAGTASGASYKLRIISSNPVVTGSSSADFTINQAGLCSSSPTDYFRSRTSGDWSAVATWESSATGTAGTWINATLTPTSSAKTISIRNSHTVTTTVSVTIDETVIEPGGILINQMSTGNQLTIANDGSAAYDLEIQSGGMYHILSTLGYSLYQNISSGATIVIRTGGIIKVGDGSVFAGSNNHLLAATATSYVWENGSVFEWYSRGAFTTSGVTFFPDADNNTIPVFRITNPFVSVAVGAGSPNNTIINGLFESAGQGVIWQNSATRIFRNGITGSGLVDGVNGTNLSGKFIINGQTAVLGGTGSLIVPSTGFEIGSASNSVTVTVSDNKVVTGSISLLSTNPSYVVLNASNLTVSGTISGGSATSYIKTNNTGAFILGNVAGTRFAPVGNSTYNPLTITNTSGHNWSVRVEDALGVSNPVFSGSVPKAVQREWHITPSVNPPLTGADIVFEYDDNPLAIPRQTGVSFNNTENVQTWHEIFYVPTGTYEWLAAGNAQPPSGTPGGTRTVSIFNWTWFSPFAISNISAPLPIKLTRFDAVKLSASRAMVSWELAACCSKEARFELEKSTDGRNYTLLTTLAGSESSKQYSYTDNQLTAGITWYRLKATDADGKITYSRVATIVNDDSDGLVVTLSPNPAGEQAVVSVMAAKKATVQFSIISSSGVVLKQWQQAVVAGTQTAAADISALPAGIYQLLCQSEAERVVVRFVKN